VIILFLSLLLIILLIIIFCIFCIVYFVIYVIIETKVKSSNSDIIINPKYIKNNNMQTSIRLFKKKIKCLVWAHLLLYIYKFRIIQDFPKFRTKNVLIIILKNKKSIYALYAKKCLR